MVGGGGAVFRSVKAAAADRGREVGEGLRQTGGEQELHGPAEVGRGVLVEENCRRWRQRIAVSVLGEETQDGEVVAEDPDAPFRTLAPRRNLSRGGGRIADGGEQSEINCSLQGGGLLESIDRFKEQLGGGWGGGVRHGWEWFEFA